jgi:hypothetical protein
LGEARDELIGIAVVGQRDEEDPLRELVDDLVRRFQAQARLAGAARSDQGHQARLRIEQQFLDRCELRCAPDEWGRLGGQVMTRLPGNRPGL